MHSAECRCERIVLALALVVGTLARLAPLGLQRFHEDEALYSYWGLRIASGEDVLLSGIAVDKPPAFLYLQACALLLLGPSETAARVPALLASVANIGLLYFLARRLYDQPTALLSSVLMAASPFAISFSPTAFMDPVMSMWVLLACHSIVHDQWSWAGSLLGLAAATKWEGVTFLPLLIALGLAVPAEHPRQDPKGRFVRASMAFLAVGALITAWDVVRPQPSILESVGSNYGGLTLAPRAVLVDRLQGWVKLLTYVFYHPWLNVIFAVGLPLLLASALVSYRRRSAVADKSSGINTTPPLASLAVHVQPLRIDLLLIGFLAFFLALITLLRVPIWDRYLLAQVPLVCLLLARVLRLPARFISAYGEHCTLVARPAKRFGVLLSCLIVALLLATLPTPLRDAATGRFPIGGDHGSYQGIEQVVAYFRGHVMGGSLLYHRWLGNHYRFYMYRFPYTFRWWQAPQELARHAATTTDVERWIVFPSWQDEQPARAALSTHGLRLTARHQTYRDDGSPSFTIYQIEGPR